MIGKRRGLNRDTLGPGNHNIGNNVDKYNLIELRAKSIGHKFNLVSTHLYKGVSQSEIDLRIKYASSLISNYSDVSTRRIELTKIKYDFTISSRIETYAIHIGGRGWGKVVITISELPTQSMMSFVIFKTSPKGKYSSTERKRGTWNS